jgi:hypothetical protein
MEDKLKDKILRAKQCRLYGEIIFSHPETLELFVHASKIIEDNRVNKMIQFDTQVVFLAIVNACKDWSYDESNFWPHVFEMLGIRQYSQSNLQYVYKSITSIFSCEKRNLYKTASNKNTYYSLILAHALGPKETMFHLFDLFFSVYHESLLGYYRPNDIVFTNMAESLRSRINHLDNADDTLDIGGKVYTMKSSIRHMITHDTEIFIYIIDKVMAYFDGSLEFDDTDYLCSLLEIWKKRNNEVREILARNRYRARIGFSEIDKYIPRYSLSGNDVLIEFPNLRLNSYKPKAIYYCKYTCHNKTKSASLRTFGNELVMNFYGFQLKISDIDIQKNAGLDLRVQIFEDSKVIFDSEDKLHRKSVIFKDDKEVYGNQLDLGNYWIYTPYYDDAENANFEYVDKYLYFAKFGQSDLFTIAGQTWFVASEESRGQISKDIYVRTQKIPFVRFKEEKTIIEYEVIKKIEKISFIIPDNEDIKSIEIIGNDRKLEIKIPEDYNTKILEALKFPPFFSEKGLLRIAFLDSETGERIKVVNYLVLPNFDVQLLNRMIYGRRNNILIDNIEYDIHDEEELKIPCYNGHLFYTIPRFSWIFEKHEHFENGPNVWFEELSTTSVITLKYPVEYSGDLIMYINNVEVNNHGNSYFIGQTIYKNTNKNWKSLEEVYVIDQGESAKYLLFKLIFKEHLFGKPYLVKENGILYWDVEDIYSGLSNPKFKVYLINRQGHNQIFYFDLFGEAEAPHLSSGEYRLQVYRITNSPFEPDIHLYDGSIRFGDDSSIRFNEIDIRIKKVMTESSIHKEKVNLLISDIAYVKTNLHPEYTGLLYQENKKSTDKVYLRVLDKSTLHLYKLKPNGNQEAFTFDTRTGKISEKSADDKFIFKIDYFYYEEVKNV